MKRKANLLSSFFPVEKCTMCLGVCVRLVRANLVKLHTSQSPPVVQLVTSKPSDVVGT